MVWIFRYRPAHRWRLRSFPTRRSSDLVVQRAALVRQLSLSRGGFPHGVLQPAAVRLQIEAVRAALAAARSEEHTSELQSRGHLVCRLLLEKKKKQMKWRTS